LWRAWLLLFAAATSSALAQSTPLLWEVRSATNVAYVLGTVHVGREDMYPLGAAVEQAYRESRTVALELDPLDQQSALGAMMSMMYAPPDDLSRNVSPASFERLRGVLARLGLPVEMAQRLRPFMAASLLVLAEASRLGFRAPQGVDHYFAQRARQDGKRLVSLESFASQAALMNSLSPALQERYMDETVKLMEREEAAPLLEKMMRAWRTGDADGAQAMLDTVRESLPGPLHEEFHARFLRDRNVEMAKKVDTILRGSEPHFVAVGTFHMLGRDNILDLLAKSGFKVRRL
jgi:uncharacterized protein YbaP (TraB family)